MSTTDRPIPEIADEYVLGLLDPADAEAVEREVETNPALRAAVAESRDRFLALDLTAEPVAVEAALWDRIEADLESSERGVPATDTGTGMIPAGPAGAANDNRLSRWRAGALGAMAASLLLAIGLAWSLVTQPEPRVIAVLLNEAGEPQAIVEDFGDSSARVVLLADFKVPDDKTMQVWTLPSADTGPVSLGLLDSAQSAVLRGPELPEPRDDQLYEITLEQAGGSPTGRPTGPILVKGFAKLPRD